jgi:two-component system sensor histidine kinase VicK
LLEGGVEDAATAKEFLGIINSETDRMNRLVKDLLQLSRLDTKQQKWYKEEGDIVKLVRTAVKKVDMLARSKNQQINLIFNPELSILIDMDRDRIEQVLLNILSNAIKYTKDRGRIDVDVIRGNGEVKIVVMDNGVGIPEKELPRVFERFFRVDKARSSRMGGTGLGLSISKQIIEEHKGSIDIESVFGKGTMVAIKLPLRPVRGKRGIL